MNPDDFIRLLVWSARNPETEDDRLVARRPLVAIGRAHIGSTIRPRSAADHPARTGRRSRWVRQRPRVILTKPVLAPLPQVAHRIEQTPAIGLFPLHRV